MKYIVLLNEIAFRAHHGLYSFEKEQGNVFYITISLTRQLADDYIFDEVSKTIDYEKIYTICKEVMLVNEDLLEQVAMNIKDKIITAFSQISNLSIAISKSNPPIGGACKASEVTLEWTF
jgi:dihydroneopterin aldolase